MNMPKIKHCTASDCAYNKGEKCHALAITVGDDDPICDTFCSGRKKGGDPKSVGGVGACKVSSCRYNQDLECSAKGIEVGWEDNQADCLTFEPR